MLIPPARENIMLSHRLYFETTNNVAKYEALILGLEATKKMGIRNIAVFGDYELVVQQVKQQYQCRHLWMRSYRNDVWDMIDNLFDAFNITSIPKEKKY